MPVEKPRQIAAKLLIQHEREDAFIEDRLARIFAEKHLKSTDRALLQELVYGCVRWKRTLDWILDQRISRKRTPMEILVILRLGVYQLFLLDRIPDHATVYETVEIVHRIGFDRHAPFVNGVLRNFSRYRQEVLCSLQRIRESNLGIGFSHPTWLVERWSKHLGREAIMRILEWNNSPPKTFARLNSLATTPTRLIENWREEGVSYDFTSFDWVPENTIFLLRKHPPLHEMPSFKKGWFYVQDPSTLLSVKFLSPKSGERILDICASPGGKATYIAELMGEEGFLAVSDQNEKRMIILKQNFDRLQIKFAEHFLPDELENFISNTDELFDGVLLDTPCSNTGVLRRRIDLRWRLSSDELQRLIKLQADLLNKSARKVRPGGRLVYSTCSLEQEENELQIENFLKRNSNFILKTQKSLSPQYDNVDGAFAATLERAI